MFGCAGWKAIQFSADASNATPPPYYEDESQSIFNPKKRIRQKGQALSTDLSASTLADPQQLRIASLLVLSENEQPKNRLEAMESELEQLRGDLDLANMKLELLETNGEPGVLKQKVKRLELCNQKQNSTGR